jgi:hypothetical protein
VVEIAHRPRDGTSLLAARIPSPDFVPLVRFGPGALSQSPRSSALFGVFEQRLRVRLQGSGPALAPRRTELRPRCDLNGWPRPRLDQLPRGDGCQGNVPTCDRPSGGHGPPGCRCPLNRTRSFGGGARSVWQAGKDCRGRAGGAIPPAHRPAKLVVGQGRHQRSAPPPLSV